MTFKRHSILEQIDGYQSAWSSNSGSGAAIAAYDWLDFTIGTDSKTPPVCALTKNLQV